MAFHLLLLFQWFLYFILYLLYGLAQMSMSIIVGLAELSGPAIAGGLCLGGAELSRWLGFPCDRIVPLACTSLHFPAKEVGTEAWSQLTVSFLLPP